MEYLGGLESNFGVANGQVLSEPTAKLHQEFKLATHFLLVHVSCCIL